MPPFAVQQFLRGLRAAAARGCPTCTTERKRTGRHHRLPLAFPPRVVPVRMSAVGEGADAPQLFSRRHYLDPTAVSCPMNPHRPHRSCSRQLLLVDSAVRHSLTPAFTPPQRLLPLPHFPMKGRWRLISAAVPRGAKRRERGRLTCPPTPREAGGVALPRHPLRRLVPMLGCPS